MLFLIFKTIIYSGKMNVSEKEPRILRFISNSGKMEKIFYLTIYHINASVLSSYLLFR